MWPKKRTSGKIPMLEENLFVQEKNEGRIFSCFPMALMVIFSHSFLRPCLWVDDGLTKKLTSNRATIRNVFRFSTEQLCNRYREGRFCSTRQLHNNPLGCISSAQQFSSVRVKTFFTRSKKMKFNSTAIRLPPCISLKLSAYWRWLIMYLLNLFKLFLLL